MSVNETSSLQDDRSRGGVRQPAASGSADRKIGHRRVGGDGTVSYKKVQSNQLMKAIQLGVEYSVGAMTKYDERDLLMQDFLTVETYSFPKNGSTSTPAHNCSDFTFRSVAPLAFRYFLNLFGIQRDDFLMSLVNEPLRELSNPGASGSLFYLTCDDEFILKTVMHKEAEFLQKLLPGYYMNLNQNPHTLLPKFFGMFCYQCNQKNIRLTVMNNLLPSNVRMHMKYDLKGSTYKRKASKRERAKNSPTFKDLDFLELLPDGLLLEQETYNALISTMRRDCRVLESFRIMDYSLLIGIHNLDQAAKEREETTGASGAASSANNSLETGSTSKWGAIKKNSVGGKTKILHSTAMESIQAQTEPIDDQEHVPPGGIPARNHKGERLLLFLGIIDILQSYRMRKKLEHTLKSIIHDGDTVSVHRPGFYAHRFLDFMADKVFKKVPSPLKHSPSKRSSKKDSVKKNALTATSSNPTTTSVSAAAAVSSTTTTIATTSANYASTTTAETVVTSSLEKSSHYQGSTCNSGRPDVIPGDGINRSRPSSAAAARLRQTNGRQNSQCSSDAVSVNDVKLYYGSNHGTPSRLSVGTTGWNTPTPTWTEGTPSFTESTFSGADLPSGQSKDDILMCDETLQLEV